MKKIFRTYFMFVVSCLSIAACTSKKSDDKPDDDQQTADTVKPYFIGVPATATCVKGSEYDALAGVSAMDAVDGDVTNKIVVTTDPVTTVTNGKFIPDQVGTYEVTYAVTDNAGNTANAWTELNVTKALSQRTVVRDYSFTADLKNWEPWLHDNVEGTHGIEDGVYRFKIQQSTNVDWHIKYSIYNLVAESNHTYAYEIKINSSVSGTIKVLGADRSIQAGKNTIKVNKSFSVSQNYSAEILLGTLQGPFVLDIESIKVTDSTPTIEESTAITKLDKDVIADYTFNGSEWNCEYNHNDHVVAEVAKAENYVEVTQTASGDGWEGKLLIHTTKNLEVGKTYRLFVDFTCNNDASNLEFGYGHWGDDFKHFIQSYNNTLTANVTKTFSGTFTVDEGNNEDPFVCLKMGNLPVNSTLRASNFHICEVEALDIDLTNNENAYAWYEEGGPITSTVSARTVDSITTDIGNNVEHNGPWQASTDIRLPYINLKAGKTYHISMNVTSTARVERARLLAGNINDFDPSSFGDSGENIILEADKTRVVEIYKTLDADMQSLKIRLKYGTAPFGASISIEDFTIEEVSYTGSEPVSILPENQDGTPWNFLHDPFTVYFSGGEGAEATADIQEDKATFTMTGTAGAGKGWAGKIVVEPRMKLLVGKKYHVSIKIQSSADYAELEVGAGTWNDDFKAVGVSYNQMINANQERTYSYDYLCDEEKAENWGFCFKVGTAPVGTVFTVSDVVVQEVPISETSTEETYRFTPEDINTFDNTEGASELYVNENDELVYHIKTVDHTVDWYNKFFISDVILEAGYVYTFALTVKADKPFSGNLMFNRSNNWDVRASEVVELTTEYQTIELTLEPLAAELSFELLFQGFNENTVDEVTITFASIILYSQTYLD